MKRLLHKLFRRHRWERFELLHRLDGPELYQEPRDMRPWYVGYRCACGEPGYEVPA